ESLDHHGRCATAAIADARGTYRGIVLAQYVDQCGHDPGCGSPQRMTQRHGATVYIDTACREVEQLDIGQRHGRESLVNFVKIYFRRLYPGALQCPGDGERGCRGEPQRLLCRVCESAYARKRGEFYLQGFFATHQDQRGGPVIKCGCVGGCHRPVFAERWP